MFFYEKENIFLKKKVFAHTRTSARRGEYMHWTECGLCPRFFFEKSSSIFKECGKR